MPRPHRALNTQDLKLWRHVTRNASAYHDVVEADDPADPPRVALTPPLPVPAPAPVPKSAAPAILRVDHTADMDRRQARRLKRGELPIDARLDLHGLTLERAHAALSSFIKRSYAAGARVVIVVTGKGVSGHGRIRAEAPHWLNGADLRPLVLAMTQAHGSHGGSGALYVLLKRRRDHYAE